jgi:aminoglycoside phosphotransferase (APT) family kinase protein
MPLIIGAQERQGIAVLLAQRFPKRSAMEIVDVAEIGDGWETDVFAISTQFKVDGRSFTEDFILRSFQGIDASFNTRREAQVMMKARALNIPVPRVEFYVTENSPVGPPFILMEKVEGQLLSEALQDAPPERFAHLTDQMASALIRLHQHPAIEFTGPLMMKMDDPSSHLKRQVLQLQSTVAQHQLEGFDPLLDRLKEEFGQVRTGRISLLHNDYHPQNIFLSDDDRLTIFDWSFAGFGDARLDLAWTTLLFGVMTEHRHREELLKSYEALDDQPLSDFEFFEVLKFTSRMATLVSWLTGSVPIPVAKITLEAMRGEYKVHILNVYERLVELTGAQLPDIESL